MSRTIGLTAATIALALFAGGSAALADSAPVALRAGDIYGVWRNPKGSVHIEIKACEARTCGVVVWANADARDDVRKKKNQDLVGMQLLRDFTTNGDNEWKGRVYVPDLDMTFAGQVRLLDRASLRAKGCVLGNFFCKSQVWTRVDTATTSTGRAL